MCDTHTLSIQVDIDARLGTVAWRIRELDEDPDDPYSLVIEGGPSGCLADLSADLAVALEMCKELRSAHKRGSPELRLVDML